MPDRVASRLREELRMGVEQSLRQALQSGEPIVAPLRAEIKMIRDEINEPVD
jgi:hypothetical protein